MTDGPAQVFEGKIQDTKQERDTESSDENTPLLENKTDNTPTEKRTCLEIIKMGLKGWLQQVSIPVYILVMIFAIASWIDINGLWVELPLLVNKLPEGWNLPSYLTVIIQIANIGPIIYTTANRCAPHKVKEWPVVYIIISIGAVACILLAFFWDRTSFIFGAERSTALISLATLLAMVDTTSSVVFLPYMANFKAQYMYAFYIGEGLCGFIPGIVGFIQGAGGNPECVNSSVIIQNETTGINTTDWQVIPIYSPPLFSVQVFFFILFGMLCCSVIAFSFLNFLPYCKREMVDNNDNSYDITQEETKNSDGISVIELSSEGGGIDGPLSEKDVDKEKQNGISYQSNYEKSEKEQGLTTSFSNSKTDLTTRKAPREKEIEMKIVPSPITTFEYALMLLYTAWINGLTNGALPSTQSYSCLPYGNTAYTLTVRLSSVANPMACFVALFIPTKSRTVVSVLTFLGSVLAAFQLYLAVMSPNPPLVGTLEGEILVVLTSVLMSCFLTFAKVTIASILRDVGHSALLYCGVAQQAGSFVGAIITFVFVNILQVFVSKAPCT